MAGGAILALDQGTTSTRAIVFDEGWSVLGTAQRALPQIFPRDGWVEHDPMRIVADAVAVMTGALADAGLQATDLAGIGITNQRETVVLWDRATGQPVHNAIVWQDRRTADRCAALKRAGHEAMVQERTGLLLDPYFSATKLAWLLDTVPDARPRAERGDLAFGTIDSWLIFCLSGGAVHSTDVTNAARTLLFNIGTETWDDRMLALFDIPGPVLPMVQGCTGHFAETRADILGASVPILGVAGDQQAATVGQACFGPGMMKSTYGTGCFLLLNTGPDKILSTHRLLTTIGYRIGETRSYAMEGSIFMAGATMQWLRDALGLVSDVAETAALAASARDEDGVYLVPAFTGLGAPYWDPDARGAMVGMTRDTGRAEVIRAAIDSVCYQTRDLLDAMDRDIGARLDLATLRVDGGMIANDWFLQRLADLTGRPVERQAMAETTALGAAFLAGIESGIAPSADDLGARWQRTARFDPALPEAERERRYGGWQAAVSTILTRDNP